MFGKSPGCRYVVSHLMSKAAQEKGSVRGLIIHVATKAALRALPGGFVVEMVGEYVVPRVAKAVVNWMNCTGENYRPGSCMKK